MDVSCTTAEKALGDEKQNEQEKNSHMVYY